MGIEELDLAIEDARVRAVGAAERYAELAASTQGTLAQAESTLNRAHACLSKISKQGCVVDRRLWRGADSADRALRSVATLSERSKKRVIRTQN